MTLGIERAVDDRLGPEGGDLLAAAPEERILARLEMWSRRMSRLETDSLVTWQRRALRTSMLRQRVAFVAATVAIVAAATLIIKLA